MGPLDELNFRHTLRCRFLHILYWLEAERIKQTMAANQFRIIVRGFSSSVTRNAGLVKAPIQVYGTEGSYAAALYSAASKNKVLDAVEKDLITFQATLKKDPRLSDFLADPSVKKTLKLEGLASACDKLKMNVLSKNLIAAMAENGRYNLVDSVCVSFNTIMSAHRGEVVCEVTTAKALDAAMKKEVETTIGLFIKGREKSGNVLCGPCNHRRDGGFHRRQIRRYVDCNKDEEIHRNYQGGCINNLHDIEYSYSNSRHLYMIVSLQ